MSTPALTRSSAPRTSLGKTTPEIPQQFRRRRRTIIITAAATVCVAVCITALLWNRIWPFTERAVLDDVAAASDSTVTARSSRRTYVPVPGCILEAVEFHHGPDKWTLITIDKLTIEGSYFGIFTRHVPRIRAEGWHVYVPPFGSNITFDTKHSRLVVDEVVPNGAVGEF